MTPAPRPGIHQTWSVLRPILTGFTFAKMKEIMAASGLPMERIVSLRQGPSITKSVLADAIEVSLGSMPVVARDRVTAFAIQEILNRDPDATDRMAELLERVGWTLVDEMPVPLELGLASLPERLSPEVKAGLNKALRRYRDGDFDGAMTAVVGTVDSLTAEIYRAHGIPKPTSDSFHNRAIKAHRTRESQFRSRLARMTQEQAGAIWKDQERAVNGAAAVLASLRSAYADAHGVKEARPELVRDALVSAMFLINCLAEGEAAE